METAIGFGKNKFLFTLIFFFFIFICINATAVVDTKESVKRKYYHNDDDDDDDDYHHHHHHHHNNHHHNHNHHTDFPLSNYADFQDLLFLNIYEHVDCPSLANGGNGSVAIGLQLCSKRIELEGGEILVNQTHATEQENLIFTSAIQISSTSEWNCNSNGTCRIAEWLDVGECYPILNFTIHFRCLSDNCTFRHLFTSSGRIGNFKKIETNNVIILSTCNLFDNTTTTPANTSLTYINDKTNIITQSTYCSDHCFGPLSDADDAEYSLSVIQLNSSFPSFDYQVDLCVNTWCHSNSNINLCVERNFTIFLNNFDTILSGCNSFPPPPTLSISYFFDGNVIGIFNSTQMLCNTTACTTNMMSVPFLFMRNEGNCINVIFSFEFNATEDDMVNCCPQPVFGGSVAVSGGLIGKSNPLIPVTSLVGYASNCLALTSNSSSSDIGEGAMDIHCWTNGTTNYDPSIGDCLLPTSYDIECSFNFDLEFWNYTQFDEDFFFSLIFRATIQPTNYPSYQASLVTLTTAIDLESANALISCPDQSKVRDSFVCNYAAPLNSTTLCNNFDNSEVICKIGLFNPLTMSCVDETLSVPMSTGLPMVVDFVFIYTQQIHAYTDCTFQIQASATVREHNCNTCCDNSATKVTVKSREIAFRDILLLKK